MIAIAYSREEQVAWDRYAGSSGALHLSVSERAAYADAMLVERRKRYPKANRAEGVSVQEMIALRALVTEVRAMHWLSGAPDLIVAALAKLDAARAK